MHRAHPPSPARLPLPWEPVCGRIVAKTPPDRLADYFDARVARGVAERWRPSFNIGPTTEVLGLAVDRAGDRVIDRFRWGLVPSWADDPSIGNRLFNARAERVATSTAFRSAFNARRLVVLVDGYWEWRKGPGRRRQPFFFHRPDGRPLALAGLYENWRDPERTDEHGAWLRSCTIITTDAPSDLATVHDRMPVVLDPEVLGPWLDRGHHDRHELERVLRPVPEGVLAFYPVDRRVGDVRNDDEHLLDPITLDDEPSAEAQQGLL